MIKRTRARQTTALFCMAPIVACILIGLGARVHWPQDYGWTILTNTLYVAIAAAACVLTAIGLKQASSAGGRWLPSFIAMTSYKALTFCLLCVSAASGVKLLLIGDGQVSYVIGLAFPALMTLCSLLAVVVFAGASLFAELMPSAQKTTQAMQSKAKAAHIANAAVLCTGLVMAGIIWAAS